MLGVAAVATLMLSSCVGIGQDEGGDSAAGEDGEEELTQEDLTLSELCAEAPELAVDDDRAVEGGDGIEDPEEIPMPYLDQLEADEDYVAPTEEAAAQNVPEPQIPAQICQEGEEGASAALSYWFEAYWYGDLTGDPTRLQEVHDSSCTNCESAAEEISQMDEDGQWLVGEPMTAALVLWAQDEEKPGEDEDDAEGGADTASAGDEDEEVEAGAGELSGLIETDVPPHSLYDETGEVEELGDSEAPIGVELAYDQEAGHWKLMDEYDATLGDFGGPIRDVEEPELPAEAEDDSPEGALATHEYWMESFDYIWATGDPAPIQELEHPDGEDWSMFYQDFVDLYEDGGWVEFDGQQELGSPEVYYEDLYDSDLDQEAAFVYGMVTEPEATVHEPDGSESGVNSVTDEPVVYLYLYNDDAGHWQLYDLVFDTLDDIQDDLGEPDLTG